MSGGRVEESVEISRTPQDLWNFVADPMNDARWCRKVKSVTRTGESRWLVRHKLVPLRPSIELHVQQLETDEPRRLLMREEDEVSVFTVEYRIEPIPVGSRFIQTSDFEWKRLPRFLNRAFERGVRRDVRKQLDDLRGVLEVS